MPDPQPPPLEDELHLLAAVWGKNCLLGRCAKKQNSQKTEQKPQVGKCGPKCAHVTEPAVVCILGFCEPQIRDGNRYAREMV